MAIRLFYLLIDFVIVLKNNNIQLNRNFALRIAVKSPQRSEDL